MLLKNTSSHYGAVTKAFHWIMALAVIALLACGLYMSDLERGPLKSELIGLHKSLGICVLFAAIARILWHRASPKPGPLPGTPAWEKRFARTMSFFLYALMLALPLSGWAMSSAAGFPVSVFGFFTLPTLLAADKATAEILKEFHEVTGNVLLIAIGFHVTGALKHAIMDKDATLRRMLPFCQGK